MPERVVAGPPLVGDVEADVCIVGGGYTGLWTALSLAEREPGLRVVVLEAQVAGFRASGRNGGWCSALFPTSWSHIRRDYGEESAVAMRGALRGAVNEVGTFCAAHDVPFVKGGTLTLARSGVQETRLRAEAEHWLRADEVTSRVRVSDLRGAAYDPDCAALHPARLVRALAAAVRAAGVQLAERTPVLRIRSQRVDTMHGVVRAPVIVRATEGYTPRLPGLARRLVPVYSLMIATEPLPPSFWAEVGWAGGETLTDGRHLLIYAQRTPDDRIALGGRGAPYHLRSRIDPAYDREPAVFSALHTTLIDLFPAARDAAITHRWGGPLGVPRDWFPFVRYDPATGLAEAGGYVGDGVAASNLAGRTLADLVLARDTELVQLPWVNRPVRQWEPEPLRWAGINGMRRLMAGADRSEARRGRPSRAAGLAGRLLGN